MPNKVTNSKDGVKRIDVSMTFRLDAGALAVLIVAALRYDYDFCKHEVTPEMFANRVMKENSNKKLIDIAKSELRVSGEETPGYTVGDNGLTDYVTELAKRIENRMFQ